MIPTALAFFLRLSKVFPVCIAQAASNRHMADTIGKLLDEMKILLHLGLMGRPRGTQCQNEHRELLDALLAGQSKKADQLVYAQIGGVHEMVLARALADPLILTSIKNPHRLGSFVQTN